MRLAAFLLLLVAGTHYAYPLLAQLYPDPDRAARVIFYIARGIEGCALCLVIGALAKRPLVWAVCLWGAWEEGTTAACRAAYGVMSTPTPAPWHGLCGVGWYGILFAVGLAIYLQDKADEGLK